MTRRTGGRHLDDFEGKIDRAKFRGGRKIKNHSILALTIMALWAGSAASVQYSGGTGEPNDPYRIASAEDLNDIGNHKEDWDKHFIMTADIDLQGVAIFPVGNYSQPFAGVFDGSDHIIRNADVNMPSSNYVGVFGCVGSNGRIHNLCLEDVAITGENCVGGLAGANEGGISGCYTSGSVTGTEEGDNVGGLVGWNHGSTTGCYSTCSVNGMEECDNMGGLVGFNSGSVTDCYATGSIDGSGSDCDRVGGLVGANEGTLTGCYSTGSVRSSSRVGGLVGWSQAGSITACYATGWVEGDFGVGGLVGVNLASIADCYSTGQVKGVEEMAGGLIGDNLGSVIASFWDVETSDCNFSPGGEGKTTAQMQTESTFASAGWDFDTVWWMPPGDYPRLRSRPYSAGTGTAEDPYQISSVSDWQTLMNTSGDWDKHFILVNDVNLAEYAWVEFETIGKYYGWNDPNNEPFTGVFDGNEKSIWNFTLTSDSRNSVGLFGYIGYSGQIKNLTLQNADVNAVNSIYVGGLVGFNQGSIINCFLSGSINGYHNVGGLVGTNDAGTITNCYSRCNILGTGWNVGGLVGANDTGTITDCSYAGALSGNSNVGGLVGDNDTGTIRDCHSTGSISGGRTGYTIGGLVGYNDGEITGCYSTGNVDGNIPVGGLVGHSDGTIMDCYSTCSVSGGYIIGGLVGWNNEGYTARCYSTGSVLGTGWNVGGLIGFNDPDEGFVRDSFWDIETSGQSTSSGGKGEKTAEMKTMTTFASAGWDFVEIWGIGEHQTYPFLRTEPAGDLDHDKKVNLIDLAVLASHWLDGLP